MATDDQSGHGRAAVLRRQPARIVAGRPAGGYTEVFEIICRECGDDPGRHYREVSPKLQLMRGPYPITDGVAAYEKHFELHQQPGRPTGRAR
jgi:hypothetical protein